MAWPQCNLRTTKSKLVAPGLVLFFLGAVVYILRITSRMSVLIHDDHSSYWVPVNSSALKEWYNEQDVCVLTSPAAIPQAKGGDGHTTPTMLRHFNTTRTYLEGISSLGIEKNWSDRCKIDIMKKTAKNGQRKNTIPPFCRISNCNLPLSARNFHRKELNVKLLTNFTRKSLPRYLKSMAALERALVFIGDSVTRQNMEALLCEVAKLDNSVNIQGNWSSLDLVKISWREMSSSNNLSLSVHYIPFNGVRISDGDALPANHTKHHGHHRTSLGDLKVYVDRIQESYFGGLTIVVSIGSSYYSRMKFRDDIGNILDWLNIIGDSDSSSYAKNRILFRENAAQHWNTTSYGYQTVDSLALAEQTPSGQLNTVSCVPLDEAQNSLDWRNREVYAYAHHKNLHNIEFVPFRDLTAPLFNMHTMRVPTNSNISAADCTNFCFFPQLWQIVWHYMVAG